MKLHNFRRQRIHKAANCAITSRSLAGKKKKQSRYRPGMAQRKLRFPDYMTMAQNGGKVVSLTHRPPLPPGNIPGTHFC